MADQNQEKLSLDSKFAEGLAGLAALLDPHLEAPRAPAQDKPQSWTWRATLAHILLSSLIGWSLVYGLVSLMTLLF